jgi:hypothetical protein
MNIKDIIKKKRFEIENEHLTVIINDILKLWDVESLEVSYGKRNVTYAKFCFYVVATHRGFTQESISNFTGANRSMVSFGIKRIHEILRDEHPKYRAIVTNCLVTMGVDLDAFSNGVIKNRRHVNFC